MHKRQWAGGAECSREISSVVHCQPGKAQSKCEGSKSGAKGRFFITPHAIERYRERVHRGISYERALAEIIDQADQSHYVKDYNSAQYWRGPKPMRLRLLVAPASGNELPQLLTILPASDSMVKR